MTGKVLGMTVKLTVCPGLLPPGSAVGKRISGMAGGDGRAMRHRYD